MQKDDNEQYLRRQAILLMSYVPEDPEDALKVLEYAKELVDFTKPKGDGRRNGQRLHSLSVVPREERSD